MSVKEIARIQTFPDAFSFYGTDAQKILQIGNAIPPVFAEQMAKQIIKCDENTPNEECPSLAKFDVTKAAAKSPALQKTCEMLSSLQIHEYEQMRMEV